MNKPRPTEPTQENHAAEIRERLGYLVGAAMALVLTLTAFGLVYTKILPHRWLMTAIGVLALLQIVVHFRYFLHLGFHHKKEDLHLVLFTGLILLIMASGTIWIMSSLALRMSMPMSMP